PMMVSGSSASLARHKDVVWLMRAYRHARTERGLARGAALFATIPYGMRTAHAYAQSAVRETFAPTYTALRVAASGPSLPSLSVGAGRLLLLPFLMSVAVIQMVMTAVREAVVTILFFFSLCILAGLFTVRTAARLTL